MTLVRKCSCGEVNSELLVICAKCSADISFIPPTPDNAGNTGAPPPPDPGVAMCSLELVSDPNVTFHVRDGQVVGRGEKADVRLTQVPDVDAISRLHARFFCKNGQWYVQYLGSTNFLKVDGQTYTDADTEVAVYDGSIVVFSLTPFTFRLVD